MKNEFVRYTGQIKITVTIEDDNSLPKDIVNGVETEQYENYDLGLAVNHVFDLEHTYSKKLFEMWIKRRMLFAKKNELEKIGQNLSEEESDFLAKATKILSEQVINTKDLFNKLQDEFNKELCEIENFDKLLSYNKLSTEEKEYLLKKSYGIINKMREKRNLPPINK